MEGHADRPDRHDLVPARLRLGLPPAVRRHADAGPGQEPRACPAAEQVVLHGRDPQGGRAGRRPRAGRRLAGRRLWRQGKMHPQARRRAGHEDPLGRRHLRAHVGGCGCFHRLDFLQRGLQRAAAGRGHRHRYLHRLDGLVPAVRTAQVRDRARRQRAVVHVRAGADLQAHLGQAGRQAEGRAQGRLRQGRGLLCRRVEEAGRQDGRSLQEGR